MANPTWDETDPVGESAPSWEDTLPIEAPGPATSPVTAATTGLANLGGVGPWIGAAGKTGMDAATGVSGPLAGGSMHDLLDEFLAQHKSLKDNFVKAANGHPKIAGAGNLVGGGLALGAMGPAAMSNAGLAATGAVTGAANSDINSAQDLPNAAVNAVGGAGMSLAGGNAVKAVTPYVGKALAPVGKALGGMFQGAADSVGNSAADLAEKATGATAVQAQKFAPGTGQELLDRGIVKFGSSPGDIAARANAEMAKSGEGISQTLGNLDQQGTNVDRNTVLNYIRGKIKDMGPDESKADLIQSLRQKMGAIETQIPEDATEVAAENAAEAPGTEIPISQAEQIKRGFQDKVNWKSPDVENDANAIISRGYKEAVEGAATDADPEAAAQFAADKKTYGLLSPVADAAGRRATQLNQNPIGGLLDMTTGLAGEAVAGHAGAAAGLVAKRALVPRLASMGAVAGDKLANVLEATPSAFGKFAGVLSSAAARGSSSLGATDYILQQTNQDYRDQRDKIFNPDENEEDLNPTPILGGVRNPNRRPAGGSP